MLHRLVHKTSGGKYGVAITRTDDSTLAGLGEIREAAEWFVE